MIPTTVTHSAWPSFAGRLRWPGATPALSIPVREESNVLSDRPAALVARRAEAHVADRQLAHQAVDSAVAAAARDPAVGHAAVGVDLDRHSDRAAADSRRRQLPVLAVGDLADAPRRSELRIIAAAAAPAAGASGPGAGAVVGGARGRRAAGARDRRRWKRRVHRDPRLG